jgi:hypothetical protein
MRVKTGTVMRRGRATSRTCSHGASFDQPFADKKSKSDVPAPKQQADLSQ